MNRWSQWMGDIINATGLEKGKVQALALAGSDFGKGGFSPQQAIKDGLLDTFAGQFIGV